MADASDEELAVMQEEFGLHELAVEDASRGHQRPKIEEYGDSLFVVMQTMERDGENITSGEVAIFVGVNYVLSVRTHVARGFLGVRARAEREPELLAMGSSFVLYALMDAVVDRYFPVLDLVESQLETIEERIFIKGEQRENIQRLYELKAKVLSLRHAVAPLTEAVGKLHGGRVPSFCFKTQDYFRDVHDHLVRIGASLDTARDTISTAIQVNLSMVAIDDGEVNKRLAAWAAIFAVFTAFAGVWGDELQDDAGTGTALGLSGRGADYGQRVQLYVLPVPQIGVVVVAPPIPYKVGRKTVIPAQAGIHSTSEHRCYGFRPAPE